MKAPVALLALLASTAPIFAQTAPTDAVAFQPAAARIVSAARDADQFPWQKRLEAGCSAVTEPWTTTFIRVRKGPVALGVLGDKPVRDVRRDWAENPRMKDWGLVHDADRDGQIDQIVFNIGPLPFEPADATNLPSLAGGEISGDAAFMAWLQNFRTAYWQALDVNGDGQLDQLAFPARKKANGWYSGWAVVGLGASAGQCRVLTREGTDGGPCSVSTDGKTMEGSAVTAQSWVRDPQVVFDAFRKAAQSCKLTPGDLRL